VSRAACHDDRVRRVALLLFLLAPVVAACSDSDDDAVSGSASAPADASPVSSDLGASAPAPLPTTVPPPPSAPPPETGVPGLDSTDAFCAAWSRYAGSFQVVAVASSFLIDEPQRAFELEVAAADVVMRAFADMESAWPAALEAEREAGLVATFQPFATRAGTAVELLVGAGADPVVIDSISAAWFDALSTRNPDNPDVAVALGPEAAGFVAAAAEQLSTTLPPIYADPALVTDVATPLTDAYLLANCPDEGQLAGSDVEG
jgi:hypothetical protein